MISVFRRVQDNVDVADSQLTNLNNEGPPPVSAWLFVIKIVIEYIIGNRCDVDFFCVFCGRHHICHELRDGDDYLHSFLMFFRNEAQNLEGIDRYYDILEYLLLIRYANKNLLIVAFIGPYFSQLVELH